MKLEEKVARQIEKRMGEFHYSTKTEFVREAIRDKLRALESEEERKKAFEKLLSMRGAFKGKGRFKTDEEFHEWRNKVGDEYLKQLENKFNQK